MDELKQIETDYTNITNEFEQIKENYAPPYIKISEEDESQLVGLIKETFELKFDAQTNNSKLLDDINTLHSDISYYLTSFKECSVKIVHQ